MPSSNMYSSKQTCEIVGISYRQLDYWDTKGLFVPTETANGSGSRRKYSFEDLIKLRVIKKMLDNGMKLEEIKRATDFLSKQGIDFGNADLIMTRDSVFLNDADNPGQIVDLIKTGQGVFTIVALSQAHKDVNDKIALSSADTIVDAMQIA